jgi:hypothetical protein
VSDTSFYWFVTAATGGFSSVWLVWDARNLMRLRDVDRSDPIVRDKQFGYVMGIVMGLIGIVGCLRFHLL